MVAHYFDPVQYPLLGPKLADATEHWIRLFKAALKLIWELVGWPTFLLYLSTIDAFITQDMTGVNSSLKTENVLNNDWDCYLALSDLMWPLYSIQNGQSERYWIKIQMGDDRKKVLTERDSRSRGLVLQLFFWTITTYLLLMTPTQSLWLITYDTLTPSSVSSFSF